MGEYGQITAWSPRVEVIEDESEMSISDETEFLQYIDSVCIKQYGESDVTTYSRINETSYKVYVGSQACCEKKVLFASGRTQGSNAFLDYLDEIKHLISLRRCANVSEFRGIVLDDTRRHLRSYLLELPMLTSLEYVLALANSRSRTIPWLIRELWAWPYGYSWSTYPKKWAVSAQGLLVRTCHVPPVRLITQTQWSSQNAVVTRLLTFATSSEVAASQILNPESQQASWLTRSAPGYSLIILQPRSRKH